MQMMLRIEEERGFTSNDASLNQICPKLPQKIPKKSIEV